MKVKLFALLRIGLCLVVTGAFTFFQYRTERKQAFLRGPPRGGRYLFSFPTMNTKCTQSSSIEAMSEQGGHFCPATCSATQRTAVVIPFKDRVRHLQLLLQPLHNLLQQQKLDYSIFVVEPVGNGTFNRAKLMNIGFMEALKFYPWTCFIFHDVDMIPLDNRIPYDCSSSPAHLAAKISKFNFELPYQQYFGGVVAFKAEHYRAINGASNKYWGWGGEDDDLWKRVALIHLNVTRYPEEYVRYRMVPHGNDTANPENRCRFNLLRRRYPNDGLRKTAYELVSTQREKFFTHIKVDLLENVSRYHEKAWTRRCSSPQKSGL